MQPDACLPTVFGGAREIRLAIDTCETADFYITD
jgi:hypothetical protein